MWAKIVSCTWLILCLSRLYQDEAVIIRVIFTCSVIRFPSSMILWCDYFHDLSQNVWWYGCDWCLHRCRKGWYFLVFNFQIYPHVILYIRSHTDSPCMFITIVLYQCSTAHYAVILILQSSSKTLFKNIETLHVVLLLLVL